MTSCCIKFAIISNGFTSPFEKKEKKNCHLYNTILSLWHIISRHYKKSLLRSQIYHGYEELSTDTNYPIWRRQKLPYMKKTRKKKQVCGAACFMAAEIKFSEDVRTYYTSKQMYNWMKWLRYLGGWHFIAATAINPPVSSVSVCSWWHPVVWILLLHV